VSVTILSPDPSVITFNAGTPSTTYSPPAGAVSIFVPLNYAEFDGTSQLTALTIATASFSRLTQVEDASNNQAYSEIWWMNSATIPGGSGLTVSETNPGAWTDLNLAMIAVSGCITTAPTVFGSDHNGTGASPSATVACNPGDLIVACACNDRAGTAFGAWGNSFTSVAEASSPGALYRSALAYKIAVSTSETATVVNNSGTAHSCTLAVAVIPQAGGGTATIAWVRGS